MGSSAPMSASTLPVMLRASSGCTVESPEWKPTTALRSAPPRASSNESVPPKQKPMAARRSGSVRGSARRMSRPAVPTAKARAGSDRSSPMRAIIWSRSAIGLPVAVVVEREGDVAQLVGDPGGPLPGMIVEPGPLVADQDAGTLVVAAVVGQGEGADHGAAVGFVGDVAGGGHGCTVPSTRCTPYWRHMRGNPGRRLQLGLAMAAGGPAGTAAGGLRLGVPDADVSPPPGVDHDDAAAGAPTTTTTAPPRLRPPDTRARPSRSRSRPTG